MYPRPERVKLKEGGGGGLSGRASSGGTFILRLLLLDESLCVEVLAGFMEYL